MLFDNSFDYCAPSPISQAIDSCVILIKPSVRNFVKRPFFLPLLRRFTMLFSIRVFLPQSDMRIVDYSDFADFSSLHLFHIFEIDDTPGNFKFKFREFTFICLELAEAIIINHASDVSMVFELFLI